MLTTYLKDCKIATGNPEYDKAVTSLRDDLLKDLEEKVNAALPGILNGYQVPTEDVQIASLRIAYAILTDVAAKVKEFYK